MSAGRRRTVSTLTCFVVLMTILSALLAVLDPSHAARTARESFDRHLARAHQIVQLGEGCSLQRWDHVRLQPALFDSTERFSEGSGHIDDGYHFSIGPHGELGRSAAWVKQMSIATPDHAVCVRMLANPTGEPATMDQELALRALVIALNDELIVTVSEEPLTVVRCVLPVTDGPMTEGQSTISAQALPTASLAVTTLAATRSY